MVKWIFNPSEYTTKDFAPIPEGDHRVRIADVSAKIFSSGNEGFEITFEVSGHSGKLWHYLVLQHDDTKKTNQRIGSFFDSFGITDVNLGNYRAWIGKAGAVHVKHDEYMGEAKAKVAYCISRSKQDKMPAASFAGTAAPESFTINTDDLPFN